MKGASLISVVVWIRTRMDPIYFGRLDLDPDPGVQKCPTKIGKREEISCFEELVFSFES
jgi:hypothetical protein